MESKISIFEKLLVTFLPVSFFLLILCLFFSAFWRQWSLLVYSIPFVVIVGAIAKVSLENYRIGRIPSDQVAQSKKVTKIMRWIVGLLLLASLGLLLWTMLMCDGEGCMAVIFIAPFAIFFALLFALVLVLPKIWRFVGRSVSGGHRTLVYSCLLLLNIGIIAGVVASAVAYEAHHKVTIQERAEKMKDYIFSCGDDPARSPEEVTRCREEVGERVQKQLNDAHYAEKVKEEITYCRDHVQGLWSCYDEIILEAPQWFHANSANPCVTYPLQDDINNEQDEQELIECLEEFSDFKSSNKEFMTSCEKLGGEQRKRCAEIGSTYLK